MVEGSSSTFGKRWTLSMLSPFILNHQAEDFSIQGLYQYLLKLAFLYNSHDLRIKGLRPKEDLSSRTSK